MSKVLKKQTTKTIKKPWKNEDNNVFTSKLSSKPENFKNKEKVKMSKSTIDFMCDEIIFSLIETQRDGLRVGNIESYTPPDVKKDYEDKLRNLAGILNDYKKSVLELYGDTALVSIEAYMSAKEILLGGQNDSSMLDYHLSVLEEYIKSFSEDVYTVPWVRLALTAGNRRAAELSCDS